MKVAARVRAAPRAALSVSNSRAEASRRNGAKSRGPKTPEGKGCSAMNALKHGLRAEKYVTLVDEAWYEFVRLEAALLAARARGSALEHPRAADPARRLAADARRPARGRGVRRRHFPGGGPGFALIRDRNGSRTFDTLLRYRGAAMAEFLRALRTLKALQAEQAATTRVRAAEPAPVLMLEPKRRRAEPTAPDLTTGQAARRANPNEPRFAQASRLRPDGLARARPWAARSGAAACATERTQDQQNP